MIKHKDKKIALVTGAAGFIGYHVSNNLLDDGWNVVGLDCMSDYYDISLKNSRESILKKNPKYTSVHKKIEEAGVLSKLFDQYNPEIVVHLAAQAGVRYSIDSPRSYLESNIIGTFELLEAAKVYKPKHMLIASTSSAYGANKNMPYKESDKSDYQISFYAASKKATENMAHSYSHLYNLPVTMFRFFTVYGPWGRPDMALFKFTKAILNNEAIDVYNNGNMLRDLTYIDDLISAVRLLLKNPPGKNSIKNDIKSPIAPFRVVNIGNSKPEKLTDLIKAIEKALGVKAKKNYMPIQAGDMQATWADTNLLQQITNYHPSTNIYDGVANFIKWYREFYDC